jgi:PKD domain
MLSRIGILCLVVACLFAGSAGAQSQTLPSGLDFVDGSSSTAWPWGVTATHIWHWMYDSSNFLAGFPIIINQVSFRANGGSTPAGGTFQNVEITLSSATIDYLAATATSVFANNMDVDQAVVFTGSVTIPGGLQPNPANWVSVPIAPFYFDPAAGKDFIVQIRTPGPGNVIAMGSVDYDGGTAVRYGNLTNAFALAATTGNTGTGGGAPVVKIDYTPASGLYPNFSASPTSGAAPLMVNFTDTTFTSDPGGVLTWAWDFEDDGINDAFVQNPSHQYFVPGPKNVRLTVTDSLFGSATILKTGFVNVAQYPLVVTTSGGGVGDLQITGIPPIGAPTMTTGYTLVTFVPAPALGTGPVFGIIPDALTWLCLTTPASVGNPLHYVVAPGAYPDFPFFVPAPTLAALAGQTADFVQVGLTASQTLAVVSNVARATF